MTGSKTGYLVALVAAVLVLLASITGTVVYVTSHTGATAPTSATGQPGGWGNGWSGTQNGQTGDGGWDGMGGMMGGDGDGWMGDGDGWTVSGGTGSPVTLDQARTLAQDWIDTNAPGAALDAGTAMGSGYRFTVTQGGQTVAWVWVDAATGRLGARAVTNPSASPTA